MKNFIEQMESKLNNSSCGQEQFEIVEILNKEKERAQEILMAYHHRMSETGTECKSGACEFEEHIIEEVDRILNYNG